MARLATLIGIMSALAVSPAFAFKKAEPAAPAAAAPETTAAPAAPQQQHAGRGQGALPNTPPPAPAVPATPAVASSAPVAKPAEVARPAVPSQPEKSAVAPVKPAPASSSQADAQRQVDAELAKLKALQEREVAKIKARPVDPVATLANKAPPAKTSAPAPTPAVSQESRNFLKGLDSVLDSHTK